MPNAGLPVLGANGASYPLTPVELATAHEQFVQEFGLGLVGGCCGTTPAHMRAVVERLRRQSRRLLRTIEEEPGVASLYQHVSFDQDASYLAIGERTNANGSQGLPRGDARRALGRLRRHRPQPDPRGRPPARRLRRLRRAATASPTSARSSRGSRAPPRCRSSSTPPSRRCCRPAWSSSAAARSSTR